MTKLDKAIDLSENLRVDLFALKSALRQALVEVEKYDQKSGTDLAIDIEDISRVFDRVFDDVNRKYNLFEVLSTLEDVRYQM